MKALSSFLQPELIAILISLCAIAGVLLVLSHFVRDKEIIQKKLNKVDAELQKLYRRVEARKESIAKLKKSVDPLAAKEKEMKPYHEQLQKLLTETKEAEADEERKIEVGGQTPAKKKEKEIGKKKYDWE